MADIRIRANPLLLIGFAVAVAIVAIVVATALGGGGGGGGTARTEGAQLRGITAARAAPASRPPPDCPSTVSKPLRSRMTIGDFDRAVWCERYRATPNSSINQFVGAP